jgi:hypothetical protein
VDGQQVDDFLKHALQYEPSGRLCGNQRAVPDFYIPLRCDGHGIIDTPVKRAARVVIYADNERLFHTPSGRHQVRL